MIPTVAQQLRGIHSTMVKSILPALPPDDSFVQEQAGLVLATLDWLLDVQESEMLYEATERDEYLALLDRLSQLSSAPLADTETVPTPCPLALPDLVGIRSENRDLKVRTETLFRAIATHGSGEDRGAARTLMLEAAARQAAREQAWFRMTGFPDSVTTDIRSVLTGAEPSIPRQEQ